MKERSRELIVEIDSMMPKFRKLHLEHDILITTDRHDEFWLVYTELNQLSDKIQILRDELMDLFLQI